MLSVLWRKMTVGHMVSDMELGAGGNLLYIPRRGECLWYLRRILKEVKVCELSVLWRKASQIADSSSNALRHEYAIV